MSLVHVEILWCWSVASLQHVWNRSFCRNRLNKKWYDKYPIGHLQPKSFDLKVCERERERNRIRESVRRREMFKLILQSSFTVPKKYHLNLIHKTIDKNQIKIESFFAIWMKTKENLRIIETLNSTENN